MRDEKIFNAESNQRELTGIHRDKLTHLLESINNNSNRKMIIDSPDSLSYCLAKI